MLLVAVVLEPAVPTALGDSETVNIGMAKRQYLSMKAHSVFFLGHVQFCFKTFSSNLPHPTEFQHLTQISTHPVFSFQVFTRKVPQITEMHESTSLQKHKTKIYELICINKSHE